MSVSKFLLSQHWAGQSQHWCARALTGKCWQPAVVKKQGVEHLIAQQTRGAAVQSAPAPEELKGLITGVWQDGDKYVMTPKTQKYDKISGGKIAKHISERWGDLRDGKAVSLVGLVPNTIIAVGCIGPKNAGYNPVEEIDTYRENVRYGMGRAMHLMGKYPMVSTIIMDPCGDAADAVAEVVKLTDWPTPMPELPQPGLRAERNFVAKSDHDKFAQGFIRAEAQNWARKICQMPEHRKQPSALAKIAHDTLTPLGIKVEVHDEAWIKKQGMESFVAMANGSSVEPLFLECSYAGTKEPNMHVLMSALGITFESGGLCLRDPISMSECPGSMAGAAVALATLRAIAQLKIKLNVACVIPVCENLISGCCVRVGDLYKVTDKPIAIKIERTDLGGYAILADTLAYGQRKYKSPVVVNVATLTNGVKEATGNGAFACFTNDEKLWNCMKKAGAVSGDRPWRLPLWEYYQAQLRSKPTKTNYVLNQGSDPSTTCLGAAFLQVIQACNVLTKPETTIDWTRKRHQLIDWAHERQQCIDLDPCLVVLDVWINFVTGNWLHMDITGVTQSQPNAVLPPYLNPHIMSGRPVRTVINFLDNIAQGCDKAKP